MMPTSIAVAHEQIIRLRVEIERLRDKNKLLRAYADQLYKELQQMHEDLSPP